MCFLRLLLPSAKGETTTGRSLISSAAGQTGWIKLIPSPLDFCLNYQVGRVVDILVDLSGKFSDCFAVLHLRCHTRRSSAPWSNPFMQGASKHGVDTHPRASSRPMRGARNYLLYVLDSLEQYYICYSFNMHFWETAHRLKFL